MDLGPFFKSIIEQDNCAVLVCGTDHTIIYMNEAAAENYSKYGGFELLGRSLLSCHNEASSEKIRSVVSWFGKASGNNRVHTFYNQKQAKDVYMIALRNDSGELIGYYEKHEYRTADPEPFYDMP